MPRYSDDYEGYLDARDEWRHDNDYYGEEEQLWEIDFLENQCAIIIQRFLIKFAKRIKN